MSISKNLTFTSTTQIISFIFGVGFSVLVARLLGPEGQGHFTLWILIPTLLARFGNLGFDASFSYFSTDKRFDHGFIFFIWFLLVALCLCLYSIFLMCYHFNFFDIQAQKLPIFIINTLGILTALFMSRTLLMSFLVGQNKIKLHSALSLVESVVPLIIVLGLMWFLKISAEIVFMAILTTMIVVNLMLFVRSYTGISLPNSRLTYIAFQYGIKSWLNNLINQLIYRSDMLMIAYFLGIVEVGLYSVALLLVEKSWFFTTAISNALFPIIRRRDDGPKLVARLVRFSVIFSLLFALFLMLTAEKLLPFIFGDDFILSVSPLLWLLPGALALTVPKILVTQFSALDKMQLAIYSSAPGLVVNIALNLILIPRYGLQGAAIGTSISYIVYGCLNIYFFKKLTKVNFNELLIFKKQDWKDFIEGVSKNLGKFKKTY